MHLPFHNLIGGEDLKRVRALMDKAPFEDGKLTAGGYARDVKNNLQMPVCEEQQEINQILRPILSKHELFNMAAYPKYMRDFLLTKSTNGGGYGNHVDEAVMPRGVLSRVDVSMTIFLNSPEDYEGGELVVEEPGGQRRYKMAAGSAILYPSTSLHRVEPVTKGERLVACTWIQSMVREPERREVLFDLHMVRRGLMRDKVQLAEMDLLMKSHANLLRQWAEI